MSVNLQLIFEKNGPRGRVLPTHTLGLDHQDYELFRLIVSEAIPLADGCYDYMDDRGLVERDTDPYGMPLTYMSAHTLAKHLATADLRGWDVAVLAFVKALRPEARVVLWWN